MKKSKLSFLPSVFVILLFLFVSAFYVKSINNVIYYNENRDSSIAVDAVVSGVRSFDDDDDTDFRYFVDYEYDGHTYTDVEWKEVDDFEEPMGADVSINISTKNPGSVFQSASSYTGLTWICIFLIAGFLLFFTHVFRTHLITREQCTSGDRVLVTEFMAISKLTNRYIGLFTVISGTALITLNAFIPLKNALGVGILLLLTGSILQLVTLNNIKQYKTNKKTYLFKTDVCTNIDVVSDSDGGDTYYAHFKDYQKKIHAHLNEGATYHLLLNEKGIAKEVYHAENYIPASQSHPDETNSCEKLVVKCFALSIVISALVTLICVLISRCF